MNPLNPISKKNSALVFHWLARVGSIISIGLILCFFIGEGFNPSKLLFREWLGLLFFPCGIMVGMIVGWWREKLGGLISVSSLIIFYAIHFMVSGNLPHGMAWLVFTSPGLLFLISSLFETI